jgi:hypothetical protein
MDLIGREHPACAPRRRAEDAMKQLVIVLCLLVSTSACRANSARLPTAPSFPSAASATVPSAPPQSITVGTEVTGTLKVHGAENVYELTAPSNGTLVALVSWAPTQGRLQLDLADKQFANFPDNVSPIVGQLHIAAGLKYRIRVADGAPWDYDALNLPFVLTTSIER